MRNKKGPTLRGSQGKVTCLAFSPDGKLLASGSADTTIILWDMEAALPRVRAGPAPPGRQVTGWWNDLGSKGPALAYRAVCGLMLHPEQAVPALAKKLTPAGDEDKSIALRVAELGDEEFDVRERAERELARVNADVEPALRRALARRPEPEVARRIRRVLERIELSPAPEHLRRMRAVEVLERIGNARAKGVLRKLAGGAAGAPLTQAAQEALARLGKRAERKR
jgi:hypothetical protein